MSRGRREVVIIGAGITGMSCAYHLKSLGIHNITISRSGDSQTLHSPGFAVGGQIDNFSRVSHAHGEDFAQLLWQMGHDGLSHLMKFAQEHCLSHVHGSRLRLIVTEQESAEAQKAVAEIRRFRSDVRLRAPEPFLSDRVLSVQDEGATAAWFDVSVLLKKMRTLSGAEEVPATESVKCTTDGVEIELADGQHLEAEVAVLACHLDIRRFLPVLGEALIAVADQWSVCDSNLTQNIPWPQGTFWSADHTYEWGGSIPNAGTIFGGGRYLRPMAGIEASRASYEASIADHLAEQAVKTFRGMEKPKLRSGYGELDCRPCDELPIIGPMFGEQRLLLSTGYMGNGISMGFMGGRCLAHLIATGKSEELPRRLWPERLRSMEVRQ